MAKRPNRPRPVSTGVTRAEFNRALETIRTDLEVQFRRIAQIQAELDTVKRAWTKMRGGVRR